MSKIIISGSIQPSCNISIVLSVALTLNFVILAAFGSMTFIAILVRIKRKRCSQSHTTEPITVSGTIHHVIYEEPHCHVDVAEDSEITVTENVAYCQTNLRC